jgi:hypothetical protein
MILTDEAIGQLGPSGHQHTDEGEGCASNVVGQMPPYLSDHAAEKANLEHAVLNKPVS